jgi:MFS family permease
MSDPAAIRLRSWPGRARHRLVASPWLILSVAGLTVFLSGPAQTYGVSSFVDPMLADLGLSRSLFSTLYAAGTLSSAGVLLLVGRQIDRFGSRLVLLASGAGFVAALALLGSVGQAAAMLAGFALLRTFGSGVLTLAARTLVAHWFERGRGRAFSLIGVAGMLSLAIVPPVSERLIDWVGWRDAWRVWAGVMLLVLLPAVAVLVRDQPPLAGKEERAPDDPAPRPLTADGLTARQAMRTPVFWALMGAGTVPALVVTGLAFNQVSIFTARGLSPSLAATTFTVESAAALPTMLLAGWLLDRYPPRFVLVAGQVLLALAMVMLLLANSPALALTYSALRGASGGLWMVSADVVWPSYFGSARPAPRSDRSPSAWPTTPWAATTRRSPGCSSCRSRRRWRWRGYGHPRQSRSRFRSLGWQGSASGRTHPAGIG